MASLVRLSIVALFAAAGLWGRQEPFSPTQAPPNARFAGAAACAKCHRAQAEKQRASSMARALERPAESAILRAHPRLAFRLGGFDYQITREGGRSVYRVSDGRRAISAPILWGFGQGKAGQTYVFEHEGQYYESRVSFYEEIRGLDLTLGAPPGAPRTLEEAAGRVMQSADVKDCFGCHATNAVSGGRAQLERLTPGITCEACHGPGADHIGAVKAGGAGAGPIFNPARLGAYELSQQFCGACHRSWEQVMTTGLRGVGNVRFQPYRIHASKCYDPEDRRVSCTACHDPHEGLRREPAYYDAKCAACHSGGKAAARVCPKAKADCASCHMPKVELPGSHFKFTDHLIRVAKPGAPYPD